MGLGTLLLVGIVLVALVVVVFTMLTNPRNIDQEEEASVEKEMRERDKRRRWWHRR